MLEVLVASIILAVAVSALLGNLSMSTVNLFRTNDIDRLTFLSKRKMDELISVQTLPRGRVMEGVLETNAENKAIAGFRAQILPGLRNNDTREVLEKVWLETWLDSGAKRRVLRLESYRTVRQ